MFLIKKEKYLFNIKGQKYMCMFEYGKERVRTCTRVQEREESEKRKENDYNWFMLKKSKYFSSLQVIFKFFNTPTPISAPMLSSSVNSFSEAFPDHISPREVCPLSLLIFELAICFNSNW